MKGVNLMWTYTSQSQQNKTNGLLSIHLVFDTFSLVTLSLIFCTPLDCLPLPPLPPIAP